MSQQPGHPPPPIFVLNRRRPQRAPFTAPVTWLELEVASCWEELFGVGPLGGDDEFFALGGDSLLAVRMLDRLSARVGRMLPIEVLVRGATITQVAAALAHAGAAPPPLVRFRPGRDRPPLVCVHPAGGAVLCYLELARRLPGSLPVYGIEEPTAILGREVSVENRAAAYLRSVEPRLPEHPWHLAGHSFGGLVAFEMARQLTAAGRQVGLVALIDTLAPGHGEIGPADEAVRRLGEILEDSPLDRDDVVDPAAERRMWSELALFAASALSSPLAAGASRWGALERFCRHYRFLPSGTAPGYLEARRFLRALRAAFRSARRYAPAPYAGRVVLCLTGGAAAGPAGEAATERRQLARERWSALAPRLEICDVPGHHFDVLGPPHVDVLAAALAVALSA